MGNYGYVKLTVVTMITLCGMQEEQDIPAMVHHLAVRVSLTKVIYSLMDQPDSQRNNGIQVVMTLENLEKILDPSRESG